MAYEEGSGEPPCRGVEQLRVGGEDEKRAPIIPVISGLVRLNPAVVL